VRVSYPIGGKDAQSMTGTTLDLRGERCPVVIRKASFSRTYFLSLSRFVSAKSDTSHQQSYGHMQLYSCIFDLTTSRNLPRLSSSQFKCIQNPAHLCTFEVLNRWGVRCPSGHRSSTLKKSPVFRIPTRTPSPPSDMHTFGVPLTRARRVTRNVAISNNFASGFGGKPRRGGGGV
jgi:hypothetical protein